MPALRSDAEVDTHFVQAFSKTLHQALCPMLSHAPRLAVRFDSLAGDTTWIHCPDQLPDGWLQPSDSHQTTLFAGEWYNRFEPLAMENQPLGRLRVGGPIDQRALVDALTALGRATLAEFEFRDVENALLAELAISWESLAAVYSVGGQLRSLKTVRELFDLVIRRATSFAPSLHAALWIKADTKLEVWASRDKLEKASGAQSLGKMPRDPARGLIGQSLSQMTRLVWNEQTKPADHRQIEPELRSAQCIAIAPFGTRRNREGALVVWQQPGPPPFDSRMIQLVETLAHLAGLILENDQLYQESVESERLQHEVEIGWKIQQTLLMGEPPAHLRDIAFAASTIPSREIDGDFYDFIAHGDQLADGFVGDVMGKGVPAALLGAATKNQIHRAHAAAGPNAKLPSPKSIVQEVQKGLAVKLIELESFVTLAFARIDAQKQTLTYVDCGHTCSLLYRGNSRQCEFLKGDNMPLGFAAHETPRPQEIPFGPGDFLILYSDGVTECRDAHGQMFGEQRLKKLVENNAQLPIDDLINSIQQAVADFAHLGQLGDDVTCLGVGYLSKAQTMQQNSCQSHTFTSHIDELVPIRQLVNDWLHQTPWPNRCEDEVSKILLAVTEAASNIMRHAYQNQKTGQIELILSPSENVLEIILRHQGRAFKPPAKPPVLKKSSKGGMGLYIIEQSVDQVEYRELENGRHEICLRKLIGAPSAPPSHHSAQPAL